MTTNSKNAGQRGVGLVEVLITLIVIAVGLLGMAALQARGQLAELESSQRAQALILLEDMSNRMNANRPFRDCYDLSATGISYVGAGVEFTRTGCNVRSDADLEAWDQLLKGAGETLDGDQVGAMIGARGCILGLGNNLFEVSVAWQGLSSTVAPAGNTCAEDLYGDETQRRVVSRTIRYATLN